MQIAMVGLGKMGANMARRMMTAGIDVVVHDIDEPTIVALEDEGARGARSLAELVDLLEAPRHVWLMVPAQFVGSTIEELAPLLSSGDTIVDGGNSWYRHAVDRSLALRNGHGVMLIDVGTSGGIHGLERGYCLMVGGDTATIDRLTPVFDALAPDHGAAERTPGRTGGLAPEECGWLRCGPAGAGHFVKMVHNGIEYGMMAAMAEGLNVLAGAHIALDDHDPGGFLIADAAYYGYDFDLAAITEVWRRGSVVSSWLLDLTAQAFVDDPDLESFDGRVGDSGEGRWTIQAAIDEGIPVPVLSAALYQRFSSRGRSDVADRALSAMRAGFGGHLEHSDDSLDESQ